MLVVISNQEDINNFGCIKWLIEGEIMSNDEFKTFLNDKVSPRTFSFVYDSVNSVKFFVNEDYEVLIAINYKEVNYRLNNKFFFLTNQEARSFLKFVRGNIEERARKMQKVVDGIDQPKESEKAPTKTTPPPEIKLPNTDKKICKDVIGYSIIE